MWWMAFGFIILALGIFLYGFTLKALLCSWIGIASGVATLYFVERYKEWRDK